MTKKFTYAATFSDGKVLTRSSHREYTAAYRWCGVRVSDGKSLSNWGFSRTHELAAKALRADTNWDGVKVVFAEVANAVKGG